jgi:hypothetical protein
VKINIGCAIICIRHCGKAMIGNIESILDFDVYRNVESCKCSGSNINCDWELWRDFIVYTDATNSN